MADRKRIPLAIIVGPDEQSAGTFVMKNLENRSQATVARSEIARVVTELHERADRQNDEHAQAGPPAAI